MPYLLPARPTRSDVKFQTVHHNGKAMTMDPISTIVSNEVIVVRDGAIAATIQVDFPDIDRLSTDELSTLTDRLGNATGSLQLLHRRNV